MDPKELLALMEAYYDVYASQEELDEAEGSYGQTPKARTAMGKVAIARREKPASEYSQKGEKTRKVKEIEKHTRRMDDGPDVGNRGKRSTSPRWSGYLGATGRGKMDQDARDYARDRDVEYSAGENKPGSGTVTKNPKKLRKQKAMGEFAKEDFELWVNELVEEGYNLSDYTWDEMYEFYLDEAIYSEKGKAKAAEMIAKRSTPSGRAKSGKGANVAQIRKIRGSGRGRFDREGLRGTPMTPTMAKNPIKKQNYDGTGNKAARRVAALKNEDFDIFDTVLEFLCAEGYVETLEEAEWLMANELDVEDIEAILEAEGSYGATPKARAAMSKLAAARARKPASEYSQKGEKTRKVKAAEKQTKRQDMLSRGLSGGKKSSRPWSTRGKMDADERTERRSERAFDLETKYGEGSITKNPKKLRKQKAMGEHD